MSIRYEMAPEAAATASRAENVAPDKPTTSVSSKERADASRFGRPTRENVKPVRRRSLRDAVNAMCKSCIYDPGSGNGAWREQVQACASSNCPLHTVRPVPVKARKTLTVALPPRVGTVTAAGPASALQGSEMGLNDDILDERRAA